jgi:hypothetical protein
VCCCSAWSIAGVALGFGASHLLLCSLWDRLLLLLLLLLLWVLT